MLESFFMDERHTDENTSYIFVHEGLRSSELQCNIVTNLLEGKVFCVCLFSSGPVLTVSMFTQFQTVI